MACFSNIFLFKTNSSLDLNQQRLLEVEFKKTALSAFRKFIPQLKEKSGFIKEVLTKQVREGASLSEVIVPYLLNKESKMDNYREILSFKVFDESYLLNSEVEYENAIKRGKGFFNVIIVETMKTLKSYLGDDVENNQKLEEAFNVLWNALERTDFSFDIREGVRSKIEVACHNLNVDDILSKFCSGEGKNLVERIADLLGSVLEDRVEETVQSSCCMCFQTTLGITEKVVVAIIPYVPAILEIVLNIIAVV